MNESQKIHDIIDYVLAHSKTQGATSAEVTVQFNQGFSATARKGEAENLEYNNDHHINITLYKNQSSGTVSLSDFRANALEGAIHKALSIAQFTEADPAAAIAEKELLANDIPQLDIYYPWAITPAAAMELAIECDQVGLAFDPRITNSDGSMVNTGISHRGYGTSNGFMGMYAASHHFMSASLIASNGDDMQAEHYSYSARDAQDFPTVQLIAQTAAKKAIDRLHARSLKTQTAPVLFSNNAARSLMGHFLSAINGHNLYMKSSFLQDSLGQLIFPEWFSIQELPHLAKGVASAPFDDAGLATRDKYFIHQGRLENYLLGLYSARKLNMTPTGNSGSGPHNLIVSQGPHNLEQLFKLMGTGLYVTDVMGSGTNIITGDYSRAAAGFWIEQGQIAYPVDNITIAGKLRDIYSQIVAAGNDAEDHYRTRAPSLLIEQMMIGGE
jgi:PmbA protein